MTKILTGVYRIRNVVNGKRYIGSSAYGSIESRWVVHCSTLNSGTHANRHLQSAWRKYGPDSFVFEVITRCSPDFCLSVEQRWLDVEKAADPRFGYNILPTAGSPKGKPVTVETRAKISAAKKGKKLSPEARANMSRGQKGRDTSKATAAAAEANRGKPRSAEVKAAISAANKGRKPTEKQRETIKAAHWSKRPDAQEIIERSAARHRGKPHSEEHREKIRQAGVQRWEKRRQAQRQAEEAAGTYDSLFL